MDDKMREGEGTESLRETDRIQRWRGAASKDN